MNMKPLYKHITTSLCGMLAVTATVKAQSHIDQGFGLGYTLSSVKINALSTKGTAYMKSDISLRLHTAGLVYMIRKDLLHWKGGSISLGAPVMGGFSWSSRYRSTDTDGTNTYHYQDTLSGTSWAFDVPVVADLNIGMHSASDDTRSSFGLYVGAGYAYSFTKVRTTVGKLHYDGYEPLLRAGIRWGSAWERRWCLAFSVRGNWNSGTNKTYGLQLLKEL
jgi:hypothetical protein